MRSACGASCAACETAAACCTAAAIAHLRAIGAVSIAACRVDPADIYRSVLTVHRTTCRIKTDSGNAITTADFDVSANAIITIGAVHMRTGIDTCITVPVECV